MNTVNRLRALPFVVGWLLGVSGMAWAGAKPPKDDNKKGYTSFCNAMAPRCTGADQTYVSRFAPGSKTYKMCGCFVNTNTKANVRPMDQLCESMGLRHQSNPWDGKRLPVKYQVEGTQMTSSGPIYKKYKKHYSECFVE